MVALVRLVASEKDFGGYITYVFECLEDYMRAQTKYIMCVRYPNWCHKSLELGEVGYLDFMEVKAGIDTWYDGQRMVPYKCDAIQFLKFVTKPDEKDFRYVM